MLEIERKSHAGIPCYEIAEPGRAPLAEVLLYHGWGSTAEKQRFRGQLLAGFGYRVVVPEIRGHGVRGTLAYEDASRVGDFLRVLAQSIEECAQLARAVFTPGAAHFIVGHSLGGMIALGAVAALHNVLNGVAAMNSTAVWDDPAALMRGVYGDAVEVEKALAAEDVQTCLRQLVPVAPAQWLAQGIATPVLLTNGSLDRTIPATFNSRFLTAHPGAAMRQVVIADAGHVVTDSALAEVVGFIEGLR